MTNPKKVPIIKRKNMSLFLIIILIILTSLNAINQYILWENYETSIDPFDQFSIGHIIFGMVICLILLIILTKFIKKQNFNIIIIGFVLSFIVAVGWELFENSNLIISTGLKYNNTRDSQINVEMDILLNMIGSLLICIPYWYLVIKKQKRLLK